MNSISLMRLYLIIASLFVMNTAFGSEQFLSMNLDDLQVTYGDYAEIEISTSNDEAINLSLDEEVFPVGMQLEHVSSNRALLLGAPEFLQRFCFIINGEKQSDQSKLAQRVCLFAQNNESFEHPKFQTARELQLAYEDQSINQSIDLKLNILT